MFNFQDEDFSMLNKSWAEITAEDEQLDVSLKERLTKSDSRRKPTQPKKVGECSKERAGI